MSSSIIILSPVGKLEICSSPVVRGRNEEDRRGSLSKSKDDLYPLQKKRRIIPRNNSKRNKISKKYYSPTDKLLSPCSKKLSQLQKSLVTKKLDQSKKLPIKMHYTPSRLKFCSSPAQK